LTQRWPRYWNHQIETLKKVTKNILQNLVKRKAMQKLANLSIQMKTFPKKIPMEMLEKYIREEFFQCTY
jgi:hypothetical protein